MPAGVYDIYIEQGSDYLLEIEVGGLDLSGFSARGQVRQYANSSTILTTFTATISGTTVTVNLTAAQTALLPATGTKYNDTYVGAYDIEVYSISQVIRLINGVVRISPEVTK